MGARRGLATRGQSPTARPHPDNDQHTHPPPSTPAGSIRPLRRRVHPAPVTVSAIPHAPTQSERTIVVSRCGIFMGLLGGGDGGAAGAPAYLVYISGVVM